MHERAFSLTIFLFVVLLFSWPFQFAYIFLGEAYRPILLVSMIMAGVASFVCGRYIFKDGFADSGTSWGKPKHSLLAFALPLFLWVVPSLLERKLGLYTGTSTTLWIFLSTFVMSFFITLLPALGEEFSWRGYLLPRLLKQYAPRKALLIHGCITWFWHLPFIVAMGMEMPGNPIVTICAVALISLIPTVMHAIVFAYFWSTANSLAVATTYHSAFDEIRDTLQSTVGYGSLVEIWQMAVLTILGLVFLWRTNWLIKPQTSSK